MPREGIRLLGMRFRSRALERKLERARALRQPLPPPDERRALRLDAGLTQSDVAEGLTEMLGRPVDRGAVSRWERGLRNPTRDDAFFAYEAVLERLQREVRGDAS